MIKAEISLIIVLGIYISFGMIFYFWIIRPYKKGIKKIKREYKAGIEKLDKEYQEWLKEIEEKYGIKK